MTEESTKSTQIADDQELVIGAYYLQPKPNGEDYWIYPKRYSFKTTYGYLKTLQGHKFVNITTQLPDHEPTTVQARLTQTTDFDSKKHKHVKPLGEVEIFTPTKAQYAAWKKWQHHLTREWWKKHGKAQSDEKRQAEKALNDYQQETKTDQSDTQN